MGLRKRMWVVGALSTNAGQMSVKSICTIYRGKSLDSENIWIFVSKCPNFDNCMII